ncbi:hypothetical protein ACP70R_009154 [Stipagrostis hirtigluma subsp. patula]
MKLQLSLGGSLSPLGSAVMPLLTSTRTGKGEGHELVLELGVSTAKGDDSDSLRNPMQPEDEQEADDESGAHSELYPVDLNQGCPLPPASAETGNVNSEVYSRGFDVNTVPVDGNMSQARSLSSSSMQEEVTVQQAAKDNGGVRGGARKKLRLTKAQSAFLEHSFNEHGTLTLIQKSDIANRLNIRPRQVEIWFQNRRARTKLKQTLDDYKNLKTCCEMLTQENRRLEREVAELRAVYTTCSFYSHMPAGFGTAGAAAEPPPRQRGAQ